MAEAKHGITNEYYKEKMIYGNLEDDLAKINKVFEIFNQEFFDDCLDTPVIMPSPNLKSKIPYRVDRPGEWKKEKNNKADDELMKIVLSEKMFEYNTKEFYLMLLEAMIMQYDLEQDMIYKAAKQKRKRLINNNGHYKSKEYYKYCKQLGLNVETIPATETEKERKIVTAGDRFNRVYEDRNIGEIGKLA